MTKLLTPVTKKNKKGLDNNIKTYYKISKKVIERMMN